MNTLELARLYPVPFSRLPECYQGDDCLFFWIEDSVLMCAPKDEREESVLGTWIAEYNSNLKNWVTFGF